MRGVKEETHEDTTDGSSNGDGHDPGKQQEAYSLPVDGSEGAVAETDADGGTGDAHTSGDGQGVLGEDEDTDSGTHFHGGATGWGVVGELVAHDLHDVVAVGDETEGDGEGENSELPDGDGGLGLGASPVDQAP